MKKHTIYTGSENMSFEKSNKVIIKETTIAFEKAKEKKLSLMLGNKVLSH